MAVATVKVRIRDKYIVCKSFRKIIRQLLLRTHAVRFALNTVIRGRKLYGEFPEYFALQ